MPDRLREEALGREPVGDVPGDRTIRKRLDGVGGGGDADRPLERARQVDGEQRGDLERLGDAAHLRELDRCEAAGVLLDGPPGVPGGGDALVGRERDPDPGPQLGELLEARDGLLGQLDRVAPHRAQPLHGLVQGPGPVGVHPQPGVRAEQLPHRRDLRDVPGQADLELVRPVAVARPALGQGPQGGRVTRRQGRVAGHRLGRGGAEQTPDRHPGRLAGEVVQGDVEGREGGGRDTAAAAPRQHGPDPGRVEPGVVQHRPADLIQLPHQLGDPGAAAQRKRRGLAPADEPVGAHPHRQQLALGEAAPGRDVRLAEGKRVGDRLQRLQPHQASFMRQAAMTRPAATSRLKTPSSRRSRPARRSGPGRRSGSGPGSAPAAQAARTALRASRPRGRPRRPG